LAVHCEAERVGGVGVGFERQLEVQQALAEEVVIVPADDLALPACLCQIELLAGLFAVADVTPESTNGLWSRLTPRSTREPLRLPMIRVSVDWVAACADTPASDATRPSTPASAAARRDVGETRGLDCRCMEPPRWTMANADAPAIAPRPMNMGPPRKTATLMLHAA